MTQDTSDAQAHFQSGRYTRANGGDCTRRVDPINVIFYGSRAHRVGARHNVIRHMSWRFTSGSRQFFPSHGRCYAFDFQRASGGSTDDRFHVRAKQQPHRDIKGRWETVAAAHHEDFVRDLGCNFFRGAHAVDSNGPRGSGFDQGRRQLARSFKRKGHQTKYRRWRNTRRFRQCDGDVAQSNGLVAWVQITHVRHR